MRRIIARGDASELLDGGKEIFDQMPPFIHLAVIFNRLFAVPLRRYDGRRATFAQLCPQLVGVERLVAEEGAKRQPLDQRRDALAVVPLPRQQDEVDQIAQRVHQGDDLGRQAAARAPNGLALSPLFAPVAF